MFRLTSEKTAKFHIVRVFVVIFQFFFVLFERIHKKMSCVFAIGISGLFSNSTTSHYVVSFFCLFG